MTVSNKCFISTAVIIKLNPLNAELNPIFHLLALLGAHHILHVSRIRVNRSSCEYQCGTRTEESLTNS
jgi:hypothetical protein